MLLTAVVATPGTARQQATGFVHGRVLDAETEEPVTRALVRLFVDGRLRALSQVKEDGSFSFSGIRGDSVRLRIQSLGYVQQELAFPVTPSPGQTWVQLLRPTLLIRSTLPPTAEDSANDPEIVLSEFARSLRFAPQTRAQLQRIMGRPGGSAAAYQQLLDSLRGTADTNNLAITIYETGELYRSIGRPDSALAFYREALWLRRAQSHVRGEAQALHAIARVQQDAGALDSAWINYQRALQMQVATADTSGAVSTRKSIAAYYSQIRQNDSAQIYLERALEESPEGDHPGLLMDLGVNMINQSRPDSALRLFHAANRLPTGSIPVRAQILVKLATAYLIPATRSLERASMYLDSAAAIYSQMTFDVLGDAGRVSFAETVAPVYERWALSELLRFRETRDGKFFLSSLAVVERGRAQGLRHLRQMTTDTVKAGANLHDEGRDLVQAVTAPGRVVLSYLVTQDETLTWLLEPGGAELLSREVGADSLAALVTAWRKAQIRGGNEHPYDSILAHTLLPEGMRNGLDGGTEVVVVPHASVALMPYAALPLADGSRLVDRHAVRFAPSLEVLRSLDAPASRPSGASALIVGNPRMPLVPATFGAEVIVLQSLPHAEREADSVAAILGAPPPLKGRDATERSVLQKLPMAGIVHLATHGYAYPEENRARNSFVALADGPGDDDGVLTVSEILDDARIQLTADLVVLSACETGLGDLKQAEGVVGLQRAFLAKGARSVVATLWQVSDEATLWFMTTFYRSWYREGRTKAEALRAAQNRLRRSARFSAPRYWAAFQLVGAN